VISGPPLIEFGPNWSRIVLAVRDVQGSGISARFVATSANKGGKRIIWNKHMNKSIDIEGHKALICFDGETGLFRGEFTGLNGGADFYAASAEQLLVEGRKSLNVFLDLCAEKGIDPQKWQVSECERATKLDALQRDIAEGLASGESAPLDVAAIKREARKAANI
jgi:hypothetical protein